LLQQAARMTIDSSILRRSLLLALLAAAAWAASACDGGGRGPDDGDDGIVTSPADPVAAVAACKAYTETACRKFGTCLGESQAWIDDCIADDYAQHGSCEQQIQTDVCLLHHPDAVQACADQLAGETCDQACGDDGFCFDYCPYYCPEQDMMKTDPRLTDGFTADGRAYGSGAPAPL
jgi:hypothetical protein